jgi:hypothetical protein
VQAASGLLALQQARFPYAEALQVHRELGESLSAALAEATIPGRACPSTGKPTCQPERIFVRGEDHALASVSVSLCIALRV